MVYVAYLLTAFHRCNERFYVFIQVTFFNVFNIFSTFFILKMLSNAKYEYANIQRKILLEDALAMIFIDFGLLRSPYCKISYLLADIKIRVKI